VDVELFLRRHQKDTIQKKPESLLALESGLKFIYGFNAGGNRPLTLAFNNGCSKEKKRAGVGKDATSYLVNHYRVA